MKNLEIRTPKAASPEQLMGIVNLVLSQNLKCRLEVLPQQFDLGW